MTKTAKYDGRNPSEVLAIIVRCTYTVDEPLTKVSVTETFDFSLSPDGGEVFYSKEGEGVREIRMKLKGC